MQNKVNIIVNLIDKHLKGTLNLEEQKKLDQWLAEAEENRVLFSEMTNKEILSEKLYKYDTIDSETVWQLTLQKINAEEGIIVTEEEAGLTGNEIITTEVYMPHKRIGWKRILAAAAIVAGLAIGAKLIYEGISKQNDNNSQQSIFENNKIVPGGDKATLELADGTIIDLETKPDGVISVQEGIEVSKINGELVYALNTVTLPTDGFNIVRTPIGGQYRITLPDGSKVWLNAASSLRFPIAFAGNERLVQLAGEAYFEVVPLKPGLHRSLANTDKIPFLVNIPSVSNGGGESQVQVLGTSFNIMAYENEEAVKTTLLEGTVKIIKGEETATLHPDQQADIKNGKIDIKEADAENITSWKNGFIPLEGSSTREVLNQIGRWYNVEVVYIGKQLPESVLAGKLQRDASIGTVVDILNRYSLPVQLDEENRKLIVQP